MGRECKRVPIDFDHPLGEAWQGYLHQGPECSRCEHDEYLEMFGRDEYFPWDEAPDHVAGCLHWRKTDPPTGNGWQVWETTSEGSPISPVFATAEELARWLADTNASAFGGMTATYDQWLATCRRGWAPSGIKAPGKNITSGVAALGDSE